MGRIRVLSDEVANKIAAGEVVERPASVVKELLENSLDAGAASLKVEVEGGGRRLIRVTDDGGGMLRDDAMLAFERHATSKLRDVKDLLSISTLGFRGEALPSIASVSRLRLETRTAEEATGTLVEISGGKMLRMEEVALAPGTVVTVRDLFFNVPARRKFLRSEQTELAHIASLVTHYSLSHPTKAFLLRSGTNELLHVTPVTGLRERVYQVFGSRTLEDLVDLGLREREIPPAPGEAAGPSGGGDPESACVYRLRGFVSRPHVQKLNRNSIFLFVNSRLIRDRLLLHAVSAAYHNLMPPACFPFALLFLECGYDEVDVNVHPSKTEVRFRRGTFVHDFVRDAVREALVESRPAPSFQAAASPAPDALQVGWTPQQPAAGLPYSEFSQQIQDETWRDAPPPAAAPERPEFLPEFTLKPAASPARRLEFGSGAIPLDAPESVRASVPPSHGAFPPDASSAEPPSLAALADLRPLGQIHDSFIVAAGRDGLWIVDQHVAHERILFEQVLRQRAAGRVETQRLLLPLVLELTAAQEIEYGRIAGELNAAGFETEPFGRRTIALKAAPAAVEPAEIEKLLFEILETPEPELRGASMADVSRAIAASIACHAAIKVNTPLDAHKMAWLLASLAATECPMSCPHGRPIALRYSTRDILKGFHRT